MLKRALVVSKILSHPKVWSSDLPVRNIFLNSQTLGHSWDPLGRSRDALRALLGTLGELLGHSWAPLGRCWGTLGRSWDALGALLGTSWTTLGRNLEKAWVEYICWGQLGAQNPAKLAQNPSKIDVKKNN